MSINSTAYPRIFATSICVCCCKAVLHVESAIQTMEHLIQSPCLVYLILYMKHLSEHVILHEHQSFAGKKQEWVVQMQESLDSISDVLQLLTQSKLKTSH